MTKPLVSVEWLKAHLNTPNIVILDATILKSKTDAGSQSENIQIPNARYFDIKNTFSDPQSPFPNMLPTPEAFEQAAQQLGISQNSQIVVYDQNGIYSSPRVWWMFKTMGHENVAVLDGGLPEWLRAGYETERLKANKYDLGNFKAQYHPNEVRNIDFIKNNINESQARVIDARSAGRFNGTAPEPRKDLRSGSIPKSTSLPFTEVLHDGKFKSEEALKDIFNQIHSEEEALVFSCGSGITACILYLASELATDNPKSVYDGSWTEWATVVA